MGGAYLGKIKLGALGDKAYHTLVLPGCQAHRLSIIHNPQSVCTTSRPHDLTAS